MAGFDSNGFTAATVAADIEVDTVEIKETISVFSGQGGGWHDVVGATRYRAFGANIPTQGIIGATVFSGYNFQISDWMQFDYHILHDYVPGSAIYAHVHWLADGTNVNTVKWQFKIAVSKGHGQAAFNLASPTTLTVEQASGGQYYHMIAEIADPGFSSAQIEPDSLISIVVTRITNGGTDNADNIFLLLSDLHYKSNGGPTKNKAPNFYT